MFTEENLAFVNSITGILRIELSEAATPSAPHMLNLQASPNAKLVSLRFEASMSDEDYEPVPFTDAELKRVVFEGPSLCLRGDTGDPVNIDAPGGEHFTLAELLVAIERAELETRGASTWLGGVDVHHIFFEGIFPEEDGTWSIGWGS